MFVRSGNVVLIRVLRFDGVIAAPTKSCRCYCWDRGGLSGTVPLGFILQYRTVKPPGIAPLRAGTLLRGFAPSAPLSFM